MQKNSGAYQSSDTPSTPRGSSLTASRGGSRGYGDNGDNDEKPDVVGIVAEEGEGSVRDPSYTPLSLKFRDDEAKAAFTRELVERIQAGLDGRRTSGRDQRIVKWRNQYEGVVAEKTKPWPGSANLHIPKSRSICDYIRAHIYKTLFGVRPIYQGVVHDPKLADDAQAKEKAMQHISVDVLGLHRIGSDAILRDLIDGGSPLEVTWKRTVSKKRSWERITAELIEELSTYKGGIKQVRDQVEELLKQEEGSWAAIYREEVTYDAAFVERFDILDFGVYPAAAPTFDDARVMFRRHWPSKAMIMQGVKSGCYDADAAQELTKESSQSEGRYGSSSTGAGTDRGRAEASGLRVGGEVVDSDKPYEFFRCLVRYDVDDDGEDEMVLCEVDLPSETLVRAELYPYWHDRPMFVLHGAISRPGFLYPYSLMEILEHCQAEINAIRNQRLDNGTLRNSAVVVMKRGMRWNPEKQPLSPGLVIVSDNPREDIVPLNLGSQDQSAYSEESSVADMMIEVSGANSTALSQTGGGDTTLGEIERVWQSTNLKYDVLIDNARKAWEEVGQQVAELYAQYAPDEMSYQDAPGGVPDAKPDNWRTITRAQMQTRMGFRVHGTSALANPALQAQKAEKLKMWAERSPFPQSNPALMYEVDKAVVRGFVDDNEDPERFLGKLDDYLKLKEQEPPPQPEARKSITERRDEVLSLASALHPNEPMTAEFYLEAAQLAQEAQKLILPVPFGVNASDMTDDAAGYETLIPENKGGLNAAKMS